MDRIKELRRMMTLKTDELHRLSLRLTEAQALVHQLKRTMDQVTVEIGNISTLLEMER